MKQDFQVKVTVPVLPEETVDRIKADVFGALTTARLAIEAILKDAGQLAGCNVELIVGEGSGVSMTWDDERARARPEPDLSSEKINFRDDIVAISYANPLKARALPEFMLDQEVEIHVDHRGRLLGHVVAMTHYLDREPGYCVRVFGTGDHHDYRDYWRDEGEIRGIL